MRVKYTSAVSLKKQTTEERERETEERTDSCWTEEEGKEQQRGRREETEIRVLQTGDTERKHMV